MANRSVESLKAGFGVYLLMLPKYWFYTTI